RDENEHDREQRGQRRTLRLRAEQARKTRFRDPCRGGHPECVNQPAKHEHDCQSGHVAPSRQPPDTGPPAWIDQLEAGDARRDRDVVVWARMNAIEAEGAIEIAGLGREEESQFTPATDDARWKRSVAASLDAVDGAAGSARVWLLHLHFERRHRRGNKAELPDWTNVLTKTRSRKQKVDDERDGEIRDHEP